MNNNLNSQLQQALVRSKAASHRALLVLSGERDRCWNLLNELLSDSAFTKKLAFQPPGSAPFEIRQLKRAGDFLGTNNDCVIFDAWDGFDPDAFGIISGTVNGGGLAVLISPALNKWPQFADPENDRLAIYPLQGSDITGHYLYRICRIVTNDLPLTETVDEVDCRLLVTQSLSQATPQPLPNAEQSELINDIKQLVSSPKAQSPIVLTADRGRGKSTALGLAAAKLLDLGLVSNVLVTAPGKIALKSFFRAVDSTLEANKNSQLKFVATDALVGDLPEAALLIIDEAAAIPLPILLKLINAYPFCVLSSTMHGYEGAGSGFALRLRKLLDKQPINWQEKQLSLPARFASDDPLEKFTAKLLMLNATNHDSESRGLVDKEQCQLEELSAAKLVNDEPTLKALFALLVQAHYQTKPLDLKHLLDGPNLRIFVLTDKRRILAAAILAKEQITDNSSLQDAIIHGERRPRGHLLSQQLAYQNLETKYLDLSIARIVRIAVIPELQNQALGSCLLEKLFDYCQSESFDAVGASFGATSELLNFWTKNHYQALHLGYKRNASSAAYSAVVFRGISAQAKSLSEQSLANFHSSLRFRKNHGRNSQLNDLFLPKHLTTLKPSNKVFTEAVVSSYAHRYRDFESSHAELHRFLRAKNPSGAKTSTKQQQVLTSIILQCKSWNSVSKELKLQGRKDCEALMRKALQEIQEQI